MGLFSFGGSSSRTSSDASSSSQSQSTGEAGSISGGISGSISGGTSTSESGSMGISEQQIAFEDIFAQLFGAAGNAANAMNPAMLTEVANQLFSGGTNVLENLGGDAGSARMRERLSGNNEHLDEQIGLLQEDIGRLFNEEFLPGITSESVASGGLGGGRQGVAQGIAADRAGSIFAREAGALRFQDVQQKDAIAQQLAGNELQGAALGLGSLDTLAGIAQMGATADFLPLQLMSEILGDPTVLTQSRDSSFGFSSAEDFARAFSEQFGSSFSRDQASSSSNATSRSRGRSRSASVGFL